MRLQMSKISTITLILVAIASDCCWSQPLLPSGLDRGVNFGNMLEAPSEGAWGLSMQSAFFDRVLQGGFDHIRLPVSWTHHASSSPPYTISPTFFQRVDWALQQAESRGLKLILNVHHYDELNSNPGTEWNRALAIWQQIADRYHDRGSFLYFEILNEPHGAFNDQPQLWNQFMRDALQVIRISNPNRPVLVGPVQWNSINSLLTTNFKPPEDNNLIITVHNYEPFAFTHQGASWVSPSPPVGTTWSGGRVGLSTSWQNWSWGTSVASTGKGLQVTYNQGWAGFYVHSDAGIDQCRRLTITIDRACRLRVVTRNAQHEREYIIKAGTRGGTRSVDLDPTIGPVTDIFIQNYSGTAIPTLLLSRFEVEATEPQSLLSTQFGQVSALMSAAADWARAHSRPLYLGEFGAYELGDMNSRVAWTSAVRGEAERLGIGWGYWEFAAGFGIYNPVNWTWRQPLLNALIPPN